MRKVINQYKDYADAENLNRYALLGRSTIKAILCFLSLSIVTVIYLKHVCSGKEGSWVRPS